MNNTSTTISELVLANLRDVPDFPKPGIIFKDITPLLSNPKALNEVILSMRERIKAQWGEIDGIVGIEARGFIFGAMLAGTMKKPFIPLRKEGKLPWKKKKISYQLEYGEATIELHEDAIKPGEKVVVIDDLLATGGTAEASAKLINDLGGEIAGFCFVVELAFLNGTEILKQYAPVLSLAEIN